MPLYSHADRQKHSLWIDPQKQSPPWPPCKHVNSFLKTKVSPASPPATADSNIVEVKPASALTREETIWPVYLAYILDGTIDQSLGEYKCWAPEDERDLDAERIEHERSLRNEKKAEAAKKRWETLTLRRYWSQKHPKIAPLSKL